MGKQKPFFLLRQRITKIDAYIKHMCFNICFCYFRIVFRPTPSPKTE